MQKKYKLDKWEQDILDSYERGEWVTVPNLEEEKKKLAAAARYTLALRKNKRINIRVPEIELKAIKEKALEEGLPYQTLISSLLHKYITGQLVEKKHLLSS